MTVTPAGAVRPGRITAFVSVMLLWLLPAAASPARTAPPRLDSDADIATAGYFRLSWETIAGRVELQEATDARFRDARTDYIGPDRAAVISGKPDGTWYYRVRAADGSRAGPWSEPVAVTVKHHTLHRALVFFGLGVAVFLTTLLMVVRGAGRAR